jgi:hypothetical protein
MKETTKTSPAQKRRKTKSIVRIDISRRTKKHLQIKSERKDKKPM